MEVRDRFVTFLKAMKITQREFAKIAGYRQQTISKFVRGEISSPKIDLFIVLAQYYPDLNLRWLLLGKGEMLGNPNNSENQQFLELLKENSRLKDELLQSKDEISTLKDQLIIHLQSK